MSLNVEGLLLLALVFAGLGFTVGWMGGVAEGRARERADKTGDWIEP